MHEYHKEFPALLWVLDPEHLGHIKISVAAITVLVPILACHPSYVGLTKGALTHTLCQGTQLINTPKKNIIS